MSDITITFTSSELDTLADILRRCSERAHEGDYLDDSPGFDALYHKIVVAGMTAFRNCNSLTSPNR